MIAFGSSENHFFCFTKDAAANDYPILHMEMVKKRVDSRDVWTPKVRRLLHSCVGIVGGIEVVLPRPTRLVDLSGLLPKVDTIEICPGAQNFEILSVELPSDVLTVRHFELAVLPGTVFGVMWQGLIKATADYHRCQNFWARRCQLDLPFRDSS